MTDFEEIMELVSGIGTELGRIKDEGAARLSSDEIASIKAGLSSVLEKAKTL